MKYYDDVVQSDCSSDGELFMNESDIASAWLWWNKSYQMRVYCNFICFYFITLEPHLGRSSCRIVPIHSLAGWHKRQPESGFSFVRFSFAYVCSFQVVV